MSIKDLDSWDATLQVCLTYILDDVVMPRACLTTLRYHLKHAHPNWCISNMHSGAYNQSLNIPPNVSTLLRFVNDMLMSMHPSKPQNKVMSIWLIHATTRVVDTCPVMRLHKVIGTLQEGLCMWVTVQYQLSSAYGRGVCV
jgi:hypothetical protein